MLFFDDFARADSTTLANGWVENVGDWSIASNQLTCALVDGSIATQTGTAPAVPDYYVQSKVSFTGGAANDWCGLVGRFVDTSNFYLLQFGHGGNATDFGLELYKNVAGVFTLLKQDTLIDPASDSSVHTIKLVMVGSTIQGYLDGRVLFTTSDASLSAAGVAGIRRGGVTNAETYDDFTVDYAYANKVLTTSLRPHPFSPGLAR